MNQNLNAFLTQLRVVLIILGSILADQGLDHTVVYRWLMVASGSVIVLGNALWALYSSYTNWRRAAAVGSQATLNMVAANKAIDRNGNPVSQIGPDTTPFKPVTEATVTEIVKNFAPTAPIAK